MLQMRIDTLISDNAQIHIKLREFEIEKKYEAERIKNATFELQVQLKVKEEALKKNQDELDKLRLSKKPQTKEVVREGSESQSSLPVKEVTNDNNYFTDEGVEAILSGR